MPPRAPVLAALLALCGVAHAGSVPLIELKPQTTGTAAPSGAMSDGYTALFSGDNDGAITNFSYVIAHDPKPIVAYLQRATAYQNKKDYDHAIADATEAIKLDPKFGTAYLIRGLFYDDKADALHALADFTEAVLLNPENTPSYYERGLVEFNSGDLDHAITDFTVAIGKGNVTVVNPVDGSDTSGTYGLVFFDTDGEKPNHYRGKAYLAKSEFDKAEADFTAALKIDPKSAEDYMRRSAAREVLGNVDEGKLDFTQAISLDPTDADLYNEHGMVLLGARLVAPSAADFQQAVQLDPRMARAWNNLGLALKDLGRPDKALTAFNEALKIDPADGRFYYNRALAYSALHDFDNVIADDTAAIQLNSNYGAAYANRANAYLSKGEFDKAQADCLAAIKLDPRDPAAYCNLGNVYLAHKDYDHALETYDRAISELLLVDPHDPRLSDVYSNRAVVSMNKRDPAQAIHDMGLAILITPRAARYWDQRGLMEATSGDLVHALADFKQAVALDPNDQGARNNLIHAQLLLNGQAPVAPPAP
jgi:tetratricopeptide (TPR) repeat protein